MVGLAADPAGSTFVGWSNGCSGVGSCAVTVAAPSTLIGAIFSVCGDGVLEIGEACDDGNLVDGDGCSSTCASREICGNSIIDRSVGEVCDDGNAVDGDGCSHDCRSLERCGNGIVDPSVGEVCDDGNLVDGDGCNKTCTSTEVCGNGIVDTEVGEVCDPPALPFCSSDCRSNLRCGNAVLDPGEECDNGLSNNGDDKECRSDCVINRCGDGRVNTQGTHREDCDGAPRAPNGSRTAIPTETQNCNLDCTVPRCGDGKVNRRFTPLTAPGPEQCDNGDGANTNNSDCTATCQVNVCGDGRKDTAGPLHFEQCDDGNTVNGDGCQGNCTLP